MHNQDLATLALHADNDVLQESDIAPPVHLSTTFRYRNSLDGHEGSGGPRIGPFVYSRDRAPSRTRLETVLLAMIGGPTLTYASGLAAVNAYLVFLKPKRVAIGVGYYGSRQAVELYQQLTACEVLGHEDLDSLQDGDVIHLETPFNPTGEAKTYLIVDSTFAPPGIQDPFGFGVDIVMHSGTKYFGGHHDLPCGTLSISHDREEQWFKNLHDQHTILGSVLGSMEVWLGLRSLRTLELRTRRQNENAAHLVRWIDECLQNEGDNVVKMTVSGMPNGFGPVFALEMKTENMSRRLTGLLSLFQHATSLGGVKSQVEWRRLVDPSSKPSLLRVSVGAEHIDDLKTDLLRGFESLLNTTRV
ncbi:cystathionine gamma-synthase [Aspergillus germanicus]